MKTGRLFTRNGIGDVPETLHSRTYWYPQTINSFRGVRGVPVP